MNRKKILFLPLFLLLFSCPNDDDMPTEEETLIDVTYDVLFWEFTPDTGNNTARLQYEIEFFNPNNIDINGFYKITQNADGLETSLLSTNLSLCYLIEANSSCTFSFDEEDSLELAMINSIEFISAEYIIEEQ
ncbi:MAG: hypothetical protein HKO81_00800 [Flavobacteriaceae bacterium]|nr:hypothetical protein [Bacteroidia bacterium]NNL15162.1 hypothetical protein [Flavobacteriaceae bacterium]